MPVKEQLLTIVDDFEFQGSKEAQRGSADSPADSAFAVAVATAASGYSNVVGHLITALTTAAAAVPGHASRAPRPQHHHQRRSRQAPRRQRCGTRLMTVDGPVTWRQGVPAAAAAVALLIAAAAFVMVLAGGGLQRSPRMLLRGLAAPGSRMALTAPADGGGAGGSMRFEAGGADPLEATGLIRGLPTQRMTAPDRGFSQVRALCRLCCVGAARA